jgi:hypothetical protein
MKMIQDQNVLIRQQQTSMTEQKQQFDELVDAIASAVEDEGEGAGEGEGDDPPPPRNPNPNPNPNDPNNNDEVAKLRRELQKQAKQMDEMQKIITQREESAQDEREMRLASQRDTLLQHALTVAGVLPNAMDAALKLFRDNVAYDEDNDTFWFVEDKTGVKLQIEEGIKDNMPDYLKQSKTPAGGSGARGSQATALIEQAKGNLRDLHTKAQKSGNESDIAAYHSAKKKLLDLEGKRTGTSEGGEGTRAPQVGPGVNRTAAVGGRGGRPAAGSGDSFSEESA